jgi:ABC-type transport system substrate-binding protein
MKVEAGNCNYGGEIRSVEALDEYTVKFTLCTADAVFPKKLTSPIFAVQDKEYLDSRQGGSLLMSFQPNGTGPFYAVGYSSSAATHLRVSPTYWGTPPRVDDIYFNWIKEDDLSDPVKTLQKGNIFNSLPSSNLANSLNINPNFSEVSHQPMNVVYLGFNNTFSPMDNVAVRQAIALAMNRSNLVQTYFPDGSSLASQVIPAGIYPGWSTDLQWYENWLDSSKSLLRSINYDFNQRLTLAYVDSPSTFTEDPTEFAAMIQDQLRAVNLNVVLKPMTQANFDKAMAAGTEMMFIGEYQAQYHDGAAFYEIPLLRQTQRFGNPYTDLQVELQATLSNTFEKTRQEQFDILNASFKDTVPFIPIGNVPQISYFKNNVNSYGNNAYFENYEELFGDTMTLQVYGQGPIESLWPADATDFRTFRVTKLIYDTLVTEGYGTTGLQSSLADSWESNEDLTEWTFYLRYDIQFRNGAALDANDVVASFAAMWDASSTNHIGDSGEFRVFQQLFGNLINTAR